jgi:hypothetical protein
LDVTKLANFAAAAAIVVAGFSVTADRSEAATCPSTGLSPPEVTRVMDASGPLPGDDAQCYAYGTGNPTQENDADAIVSGGNTNNATFTLDANSPYDPALQAPDVALIQDVDALAGSGTYHTFTGGNAHSGTFTILGAVGSYVDLIVALKMGGGQGDPDWFAWVIPNLAGTYDWSWAGFAQTGCGGQGQNPCGPTGLSGIGLYGVSAVVPLPAAAWLLLGGLAGLGALRMRRKSTAA